MTPHLKREVGVRELHDQLSRYVRHVSEGGEVYVTMRGRRVARLAPVARGDAMHALRERGLLREPTRGRGPASAGLVASGPVSELIDQQRR